MDDGRLPDEMSIERIAKRLDEIGDNVGLLRSDVTSIKSDVTSLKSDVTSLKSDVTSLKSDMTSVKSDVRSLRSEMEEGFQRVDQQLNDAKIRDEELHRLMKFGLEAREALRETTEARFDTVERKQDEQIELLKDTLKARRS